MKNQWGRPYLWQHPSGKFFVKKKVDGKSTYAGPIKAAFGTAEFDREYWAIRNGKAADAKTSWKALVASYRTSSRWAKLSSRTRQDYEKVLEYILEKNGSKDMTTVSRPDVIAAMEKNRSRTRFANYIAQVMSVLCEHAIDLGWIRENPAKGVKLIKTPETKKQVHEVWTDAAVAKARAEMTPIERVIFELGIGTAQRPGDLPQFNWGDYDGEALSLTQGKTSVKLVLPVTDHLKTALAGLRDSLGASPLPNRPILIGPDGARMSYRQLSWIMLQARKRLQLEAFDLHALRYRGVQELAFAGCDDDEIAAYSGHMSKAMIRKYAGEARQIMRARQAKEKRQKRADAQQQR